jgi:hypothetical protein
VKSGVFEAFFRKNLNVKFKELAGLNFLYRSRFNPEFNLKKKLIISLTVALLA